MCGDGDGDEGRGSEVGGEGEKGRWCGAGRGGAMAGKLWRGMSGAFLLFKNKFIEVFVHFFTPPCSICQHFPHAPPLPGLEILLIGDLLY